MKIVKESLTPSGALYGFTSWLTTREEPITLSSKHDAAPIVDLLSKFIDKQNLDELDDDWVNDLIPMNESMAYTDFFGKSISHENALQKSIRDLIVDVIMEDRKISEKSFKEVDSIINEVKIVCENNPEIYILAQKFYDEHKRLNLLAEQIYQEYFTS